MEKLQEEAIRINQIYDTVNQQRKSTSFFNWCMTHDRKDLLEQWDFEKNLLELGITVHTISKSSTIRPYWYCEKHHTSYQCRMDAKAKNAQTTMCTKCHWEKGTATMIENKGSLLSWCQENGEYGQQLIKEWDTEKNQQELHLNMENINYNSTKIVYWKCNTCGNEWQSRISVRTLDKGGKCLPCVNRNRGKTLHEAALKVSNLAVWCQNHGEFGQQLLKEWDTEKNESLLHLSMEQITANYMKKVHWKCEKGHEFQVTPYYRTYSKSVCAKCKRESK